MKRNVKKLNQVAIKADVMPAETVQRIYDTLQVACGSTLVYANRETIRQLCESHERLRLTIQAGHVLGSWHCPDCGAVIQDESKECGVCAAAAQPVHIDLGHDYYAVPRDAVTINGIYIRTMTSHRMPYDGPFAVLMPDGRAAMGEDGHRPYTYKDLKECIDDVAVLCKYDSTRRPVPSAAEELIA